MGGAVRITVRQTSTIYPTTLAGIFPHGRAIAENVARRVVDDVRSVVWQRARFVTWSGRSWSGWQARVTPTLGIFLINNAKNRYNVPYAGYVHLTKRPKSEVLILEVSALVKTKWIPELSRLLAIDARYSLRQRKA